MRILYEEVKVEEENAVRGRLGIKLGPHNRAD